MSFLEKCLFSSLSILNWIVCLLGVESYEVFLCILEIKLLSDVSLENMFSHTVSYFFILMMASLAMQKLFGLI